MDLYRDSFWTESEIPKSRTSLGHVRERARQNLPLMLRTKTKNLGLNALKQQVPGLGRLICEHVHLHIRTSSKTKCREGSKVGVMEEVDFHG